MYNPYDHYFKQAKKDGFKARSAFKLDEIQDKFNIIDKNTKNIVDIWCSPGSWMQYVVKVLTEKRVKDYSLLWFDIKESDVNLPWVQTFVQDITDREKIEKIMNDNGFVPWWLDMIISDMAPNTIWLKDIDSIRSFDLLEQAMWIFEEYLKPKWTFAVKVFMWPGFDDYVLNMKKFFWGKFIKVFKPQACRKGSKETYVVKHP